jgi:SAM-dependent methyltransferase
VPRPRPRTRPYKYLLGDSATESARLRAQARLWDPAAAALFDRLRIRRGWRVLEVGPGNGSLHRELRRRVRGPVDAVEPSPVFRRRIAAMAGRDGLGQGRIWASTLADTALPPGAYDLIFARWVFLFVPDPAERIAQLAAALRPGGLLAIEDYERNTLRMLPTPSAWERFLAADHAFFASQGGHASIAGLLPGYYERAGLTLVEMTPTVKTGHPGSPVWRWLSAYFLGVMDHLAGRAGFRPADAARLAREWRAAAESPASFLIGPTVVDVVGRRPVRRSSNVVRRAAPRRPRGRQRS